MTLEIGNNCPEIFHSRYLLCYLHNYLCPADCNTMPYMSWWRSRCSGNWNISLIYTFCLKVSYIMMLKVREAKWLTNWMLCFILSVDWTSTENMIISCFQHLFVLQITIQTILYLSILLDISVRICLPGFNRRRASYLFKIICVNFHVYDIISTIYRAV